MIQISPRPQYSSSTPRPTTQNGYLHLPPSYTSQQPTFTLTFHLHARLISPHPLASTAHTLTLARGPIIYCIEDADNEPLGVPVHDHFRGLHLDAAKSLEGMTEDMVSAENDEVGEGYVAITLKNGVRWVDLEGSAGDGPAREVSAGEGVVEANGDEKGKAIDKLVFVPFYYRANRKASKGVSRVGLRRWYG